MDSASSSGRPQEAARCGPGCSEEHNYDRDCQAEVQHDLVEEEWRHDSVDADHCSECRALDKQLRGEAMVPRPDAPPPPERRPPYAVAYSANGHLYEVLLPGDAIAIAEDGVLKILHPTFMIHGIVKVEPWRGAA